MMMKNQQGMTLIGMLLTVGLVCFALLVTLRVVPVYINYYAVLQSIKALDSTSNSDLTGDPIQDVVTLKRMVNKRLEVNGIDDLKENELIITPRGENKFTVKIKYQVIKPLLYNISLLFDFSETREVNPGSDH